MYIVGIKYERTPEEYADPFLAWERDDIAFFASGACHILAYIFLSLHDREGYELIHIKPLKRNRGNHMYVSNGIWAFDFNGWTLEDELLKAYETAYKKNYSGWEYERVIVKEKFTDYIAKTNHMPPEYFPYLPWERAYKFTGRFDKKPPSKPAK
jgi:hypothetical protein